MDLPSPSPCRKGRSIQSAIDNLSDLAERPEFTPEQISQAKRTLRARHLNRRDTLGQAVRSTLGAKLASEGSRLCAEFARDGGIAGVSAYSAIGSEPDPAELLAALHDAGWPVCLPTDQSPGAPLVYRRWLPGSRLAPGPLGILEPLEAAERVEPDVMFIPLIAFDQSGNRLGYGAGNVDSTVRYLRARRRLLVVGVAFSVQEEIAIPTTPSDERVDVIVTETEVIRCRA
jgi:5-formyltetrahydrofolate cyclo-ligase